MIDLPLCTWHDQSQFPPWRTWGTSLVDRRFLADRNTNLSVHYYTTCQCNIRRQLTANQPQIKLKCSARINDYKKTERNYYKRQAKRNRQAVHTIRILLENSTNFSLSQLQIIVVYLLIVMSGLYERYICGKITLKEGRGNIPQRQVFEKLSWSSHLLL